MCLVVFQKIFRKIFSGVWKMLQGKRQNQKNKHNTQIDAYDRRRSTTRCFANSNPTTSQSSEAPRRFARSRSTARSSNWSSRSTAPSNPVDRERQSGCCVCFSGFVFFLVAFSKHQKIFFGNFFEIQPNT